ncbi:MAG: thioredoxin domain-containing protein [Nitrospinaceae bacterium]|nr:MAG: thioredoxin domain-containing protein [Nitrospinaceae bacterium]
MKIVVRHFFWQAFSVIAFFLGLVVASPAGGEPASPSSLPLYHNNPVVATVEGEPIRLDDLKNSQIHDAMEQLHQMQEHALKEKILQQLVTKHPELGEEDIPAISQSDITRFYLNTPGVKEMGPLSQMQPEIRDYLERTIREDHIERNYQKAIKNGWVEIHLTPPNEFRLVAQVGSAMLWFNDEKSRKNRRVFLLEYSDFQCPFCKRVQRTLARLRVKYAEEMQFGFRHFPLPFHKEAKAMAEAVECARDQGRFWPLLNILFNDYNDATPLTSERLTASAKKAGVRNIKAFQECWDEGKHSRKVMNDLRAGTQLGIQGTPTFILGLYDPSTDSVSGEMFSGAVSEEQFTRKIEKYLSLSHPEAKLAK